MNVEKQLRCYTCSILKSLVRTLKQLHAAWGASNSTLVFKMKSFESSLVSRKINIFSAFQCF